MKLTLKDMALCALFAGLISIVAAVSIPTPGGVPFSLQPLVAMMAGAFLGSKRGAVAMTVYMFLGAIGLPVFSNGTGGIGVIAGATGGYIIGFIFCAYAVGKVVELFGKNEKTKIFGYILAPFVGLMIDYIIGVPYLYMIFNVVMGKSISFYVAMTYGFFPYILLDLVKAGIVAAMAISMIPRLKSAGVFE